MSSHVYILVSDGLNVTEVWHAKGNPQGALYALLVDELPSDPVSYAEVLSAWTFRLSPGGPSLGGACLRAVKDADYLFMLHRDNLNRSEGDFLEVLRGSSLDVDEWMRHRQEAKYAADRGEAAP